MKPTERHDPNHASLATANDGEGRVRRSPAEKGLPLILPSTVIRNNDSQDALVAEIDAGDSPEGKPSIDVILANLKKAQPAPAEPAEPSPSERLQFDESSHVTDFGAKEDDEFYGVKPLILTKPQSLREFLTAKIALAVAVAVFGVLMLLAGRYWLPPTGKNESPAARSSEGVVPPLPPVVAVSRALEPDPVVTTAVTKAVEPPCTECGPPISAPQASVSRPRATPPPTPSHRAESDSDAPIVPPSKKFYR